MERLVDSEARAAALRLLNEFSFGKLSFDDLDNEWPTNTQDPGVDAILDVLHRSYGDDYRLPNRMYPAALTVEQSELLRRMKLFLSSAVEYGWPSSPVATSLLAKVQAAFSMGLSSSLEKKEFAAFAANGEIQAWPFLAMDQLVNARPLRDNSSSFGNRT
jgi:hypothetical protein